MDGYFLAGVDVDARRGGLGTIGTAANVIPQALVDLARLLARDLGESGVLQNVFQTRCSIDFAITPADGVGGRELVVAAGMSQDFFDVLKAQSGVGLQPQGNDAAHRGARHRCSVHAIIRIALPLHRLGKC